MSLVKGLLKSFSLENRRDVLDIQTTIQCYDIDQKRNVAALFHSESDDGMFTGLRLVLGRTCSSSIFQGSEQLSLGETQDLRGSKFGIGKGSANIF